VPDAVHPFDSATAMLRALARRRVSALELLEWQQRRIERYNGELNVIVAQDLDVARRAARRADRARACGAVGPLLGLPVTFKEWYAVAGMATTAGDPALARMVAQVDARTVARVRGAGAIILGKTNVPLNGADFQADNPLFGRTSNPWRRDRTSGGSTGGAAAVAAGLTPLEFGSDRGGSIRVPASFCGVYGHRPSETALPRTGVHPAGLAPNPVSGMALQGPLARLPADLELALDVAAGADDGEDAAWRLALPTARHAHLREYRIAVLPPIGWLPLDPEVEAAIEGFARGLRKAGARVARALPEGFADLRPVYDLYLRLRLAMTSWSQPLEDRRREAREYRARRDPIFDAYARGLEASASDYIAWHTEQEAMRLAYRRFFRRWDILLAPIVPVPAFPHVTAPWAERRLSVAGRRLSYDLLMAYPALASVCGQPATALPIALSRDGLPLGVQAIGPYLEDRTPLRFAELVLSAFGGLGPPPEYAS
jgi:amidase